MRAHWYKDNKKRVRRKPRYMAGIKMVKWRTIQPSIAEFFPHIKFPLTKAWSFTSISLFCRTAQTWYKVLSCMRKKGQCLDML